MGTGAECLRLTLRSEERAQCGWSGFSLEMPKAPEVTRSNRVTPPGPGFASPPYSFDTFMHTPSMPEQFAFRAKDYSRPLASSVLIGPNQGRWAFHIAALSIGPAMANETPGATASVLQQGAFLTWQLRF